MWKPVLALVVAYAAIRLLHLWLLSQGLGVESSSGGDIGAEEPSLLDKLGGWDGGWYTDLAANGYPDHLSLLTARDDSTASLAFPPLYPLLMRGLGLVGMTPLAAGVLLSTLAGVVAVIGVYAVARDLLSRRAAWLAASLWAAGPMTIVLTMVYSEALFVALAAWALWFAQRDWWITAGVLGLLAGLTRTNGLAVGAAIAVAAGVALYVGRRQLSEGRRGPAVATADEPAVAIGARSVIDEGSESAASVGGATADRPTALTDGQSDSAAGAAYADGPARSGWRPVVGACLAVVGVPLWWLYVAIVGGRIDAWFATQDFFWGSRFDFGASVLENGWRMLTFDGRFDPMTRFVYTLSFFAMITAGALLVALLVRIWRSRPGGGIGSDRAYVWWPVAAYAGVLVVLAVGSAGFPHSKLRFLIPMFPLLLLPAARLAGLPRAARITVLAVFAVATGWLGAYMLTVWPYAI